MRRKRHRKGKLLIWLLAVAAVLALLWQPLYKDVFLKAAYPEKYSGIVKKYAAQNGLDQNLVYAVIKCESSFNPRAQSGIGAMGLMQLTPPTFDWAMSKERPVPKYTEKDLYSPEINIHYGTAVLSALLREFGNVDTAVAAYHAGRGNVKKWLSRSEYSKDGKTLYYIPFGDTRAYVGRVKNTRKVYAELYGGG
jgi:Soluble lytic murein transglycosylase and related regulatory proteins (some contain LysM/invasin domains)